MKNGLSRGSRQQANPSRPDGFSARCRLAKESAGSAKNITPKRDTRRSKPAGTNGYTVASASTNSTGSPGAAADIDNPFACLRPGTIYQYVGDRCQHDVLGLLAIGPALAARPVPIR